MRNNRSLETKAAYVSYKMSLEEEGQLTSKKKKTKTWAHHIFQCLHQGGNHKHSISLESLPYLCNIGLNHSQLTQYTCCALIII